MPESDRKVKTIDVAGRLVSHPEKFNSKRAVYHRQLLPLVGERYTKYTDDSLDLQLLERGEREVLAYCQTINGKMTHTLYQLFVNDNLNKETLRKEMPPDTPNGEVGRKLMIMSFRYFKDEHGLVRDHVKQNKVVFDPIFTFDMIMGCHLMNDHSVEKDVQQGLWEYYSNASIKVVHRTLQYCSVCNPDKVLMPMVKEKTFYTYRHLMPVERLHFEIFEPYKGELIEGKYSHVLFCRDYYSKYKWMIPLKSTKFKRIVPKVAELLFLLPRIPIFVESSTLNWQDMFDIFETIARKYSLQIGLGTSEKHKIFHLAGASALKRKFLAAKEEGINSWDYLLYKCCHRSNLNYDCSLPGMPSDYLSHSVPSLKAKFRTKRSEYIHQSVGPRIVNIGEGQIYLEMLDENGNGDVGSLDVVNEDEIAVNAEMENFSDSDDEVMIAKYKEVESNVKNRKAKSKKKTNQQSTNTVPANKKSDPSPDLQDLNGDTMTTMSQTNEASFDQGTQKSPNRRRAAEESLDGAPDQKKFHTFVRGDGEPEDESSENE